uniref:Uncharacterized protein n=1 Tax=Periophthalmus magnuspinnatus TaxID=409849 RepID=A0A3B3ZE18_9GOBI
MESSDDDTLSERSCVSEPSFRSERSGGSLSPCPSGYLGPPGDTLPWNLSKHERRKRRSQDSVLDPAERAVVRVADERDRVQKKTFTKWVNKHLIKVRKHITDLYEDLRDGHNLISLLEVLSGVTLPREKGRMRFHRLQNVQIALDFLKQRQVKLVNIRNDDITDGNPKLTLGLIWTIILHFQISEIYVSGESGDLTAKEKLLIWSQQATEGYAGLRCSNFSSSWSDGRMFNALLHRYRPDLIDMKAVDRQSNRENLEQAFEIAESLGVTRLLDAEDVDVPSPDEKSVITYVSSIYDAFPKIPEGGEGVAAHEVEQRWAEYQARFSSLLQWSRQHTALMANKNFPQNPVELKALYNEYVHFKETEIPSKEKEKGHIEHLYKLLEMWIEFGRIKLPQGLHPNDMEEEWGKLILEMLEREKALRPAVERLELLLQRANKIQNMALDCEEKLTLAKNTLQADMSRVESGESVQCERDMACYLQDCEALIRNLNQELKVLRDERYYQVEQLAFRVSCLQEELVSLRLQCSSVYRKGHFGQALSGTGAELTQRSQDGGLSLGQTLLGAVGAVGMMGAALLRRPMDRSQLVAMSSSEDEGSLRFIYELLGWVEETQDLLEQAEWGADLPSVEKHLTEQNSIHTAVEDLMSSLQEASRYEPKVSPNFKSSYSETLAKLEHQYCKLLEQSSWRLRSLESLHGFVSRCTEELIWLNEREEEELAFDWSHGNPNMSIKRELYSEMRLELEEKQEVMRSLQETAGRLCQENHPAKQTVEAYSAALQTQWQWVNQLCLCVEQHLKDNTAYFQFMSDARDSESYLRQLQDTIKRQYTCDKNSRLSKLEDLLQDSMEEKEQLIEYRSTVASLVGRAKTVVQLKPRSGETPLSSTIPIKAICDYRQIEITINSGEECVLEDNTHRTKWKVISPTGNEAMVPSVCFTIPPPNQDAIDTAARAEQLYQKVMSLWHQLHVNMKSVVSWNYLLKDIRTVSAWTLDTVRCQSPSERQQTLDHLDSHWSDFVSDSKDSTLFTAAEMQELERDVLQAQQHCQDLLLNMETVEKDESVSRSYLSELQDINLRLNEAEQRLMRSIQTPLPSLLSTDPSENTIQITEQERSQLELEDLRSSLSDVSRRCIRFFEEKPSSSSIPALRSELNYAVEKTDKLHNLSTVFLQKLKTVDVLIQSLDEAEREVKKYESRLSEEDIVPPDTAAIKNLRDQLQRWQAEVADQEGIFQSLQSEVVQAKEAGAQLNRIHPERSPELDRYQEKANQMSERWSGVKRQIESRQTELEALGSSLQLYRNGHSALIRWIEETTERQENTQPGQTDSKALSEQLAQQTALVAEIEKNQTKLDECQTHSKQYCTAVKDYELQLMTYRAFVESTHKSSIKRRRLHSSSDAITQEFMDLRTRYTALVTLTTQHVKYISDALRRLEEEEKEVEEEKQARVGQVSDLLGWIKGLQGRAGGPNAESSLAAIAEQLASKKDEVAEAIRSTEVFLMSKQASKLSPEQRAEVEAQLEDLKATYNQLCTSSNQQLQQLEQQLAKEEERKTALLWVIMKNGYLDFWSKLAKLQSKSEGIAEAIRSVEELLAEKGDSLSPEERANLQGALVKMKEQYSALTDTANTSLSEVDTAISTTVQQNTQRCELKQLQAQQAQLMQVSQSVRSLLEQPDSAVPPEEKRRLRAALDQLQAQHQERLKSEALKDELTKFLQEHGSLVSWLDQSEQELRSLGEGETDAQGLKLSEDVICHKADLRFVSISGQKVLDSAQGALEQVGGSDPAMDSTKQLVTDKLHDVNHRYTALHTKVDGLEKRFGSLSSSVSERAEQLQTAVAQSVSVQEGLKTLLSWLEELPLQPAPVLPTAQAVQEALTQNQKLRQELLSRQGSVDATRDAVSRLLQSSDASTASGLKSPLDQLTQRFTKAQAFQTEREAELKALLPRLENYERLGTDLRVFTQSRLKALSPVGQPDRSVEDYRQTIEDLLNDWESQKSRVQELNKKGSELETIIIDITAPQTKTGAPHINGSSGPSSLNGIHTCKDLTELQVAVSDVNSRYESLGSDLQERLSKQQSSLELRQKASQGTEELRGWLAQKESSFTQAQVASPSKSEVVRAQAQENKALLSELAERSAKVEELKNTLRKLISENPESPEAESWRQQLQEIDSRWQTTNQTAAQRQKELETCADRLGTFASAANQLAPWLREKELMMSVLGPLSIDPNMLNTQKQQVQFMLREFETRRPQFDQLTQSAEGILSQSDPSQEPSDLGEVRAELGSITQQWDGLTDRLTQRASHIDQAQGTSERYQGLLRELSSSVSALGERLDSQASLSAQPEALKQRLQETGEIRSELERRRGELAEAERLCQELSAIVVEPYLKEELKKRLDSVSGPLRSLEERAADGLSQLQAALSSTQQFQQMFEELRSWLDKQADLKEASSVSLPCQPEALRSLLSQTEDLQRGIASQRGSYELLQAEGASLLASLPTGGDERTALQCQLTGLKRDWEGLNEKISERENKLKSTLIKAEAYQQHKCDLVPWLSDCEERDREIQPSLESSALDECLLKAKALGLELEKRQPHLEAFNTAADQLLEQCCIGDEEVQASLQCNPNSDQASHLEELSSRLREFEEGRAAVERRLEAAKHQIEVQEALGPQACSAKSLERLRSQQDSLRSLQPQVVYLKDLAQGLVQDAPQTPGGSTEGADRLQKQAKDTEKEYEEVSDKVKFSCCSSLESRLQGVSEVQSHVRDVFSRLADLDDELDSLSPVGRDADSLSSQADALRGFLSRLSTLRSELEGHATDCTNMLRREGSSPDLLALRRETEALSRQAGKLSERGQARLGQIEDASERVREFYRLVSELQSMLGRAEEGLAAQAVVGTEVDTIKQQLQEFKAVESEQVDSIQPKLQHVNAVGQGLIQSAAKHTDTQGLEHDLETTNLRWNSLNKRLAERIAQLQEALLHCGKFQDALEPLLSWLSDTEELVANQKPPSAEYRVVKAQIQEQKLLQRLLDDRRPTVEMIRAEGERIATTADAPDRDKIQTQLQSLAQRWTSLLYKADGRQRQLEELQVLALEFHEALEPLGEWLSATERRLSSAEPMGTQTAKITQQIAKHKALNEEIVSRKKTVDQAIKNGQALLKQTTGEEVLLIQEKLDGIKSRYAEMTAGSSKALRTLEQALQLATRFSSANDDLNQWLDSVEAELNNIEPDATPAYQERQKELKKVSAEKRLVLDTVNEVGSALLDLVPWRAREGLDRLVADANQRYRQADDTITQRVQLVQAAIQRSQQYEEAVDAELAWVGETERKLSSLGPLSLEPDVTGAQLQVQRAFNIDIIRHKDTVDQLLSSRDEILETCSDAQKDALMVKTDSLSLRYEAVSQSHSERFSALEQAQVLVARFWETYEELEPWLGETESLISQLPPPAIDTDALRLQQDHMRLLRESIAEHKPHIDKLLKIGPQLAELSLHDGETVTQRYNEAERRYIAIKEEVKGRAATLDEAVSQSAQFHDKMDPLLETLEGAVQRLRQPPPVAAEVDKIREQLSDHRAQGLELDKLLPSFSALCARGEELIGRAAHNDPAIISKFTNSEAEERETKLNDVLDLAGKFWSDVAALLSTLRDSQDIVRELEDPGVDPSLIKQQIEAAEAIKAETDGLREELEFVRTLGADLIFACGETEKPEVKKTIDEMNAAWEGLNRTWRERMERLDEAMTASVQYQDALQSMFDYLDNAVIKLCDMSTVGTDLGTVKQQIEELKQYKVEVYQQQIDMEKLCHQGELLLKKVSDQTDRDMIQEPLTELRHLWDNLGDKITQRQHKLEAALLALGQFQHALSELQAWLSHTHTTLDTQRPVNSDPKAIEIELAKHHVLRNDVLSHHATVETVNSAAAELLESSPGDEASHLREQLEQLNQSWESLLLKTQDRQKLLEAALQQAEGFHGELEEFLQWLRRTDSQLSAAKPTGGLPETAREQLQQHMELQAQLTQRAEQYHRLLDQGESMLLARGEEAGPGTTQTQQNLAMLQNKWTSLNAKMDERRAKLEEAVSLATGFQSSLQDTINWLTQAEQTLNMAQPPSLILDTVLFQIDEHKVFVNEVNTHREQVLALEKAGSQLRFASLKQDVVLIKNLLLSVQARWDKLVQRSLDRGRHLDEARKRAKQFHEAWRKLTDWLEEAEKRLDSELEISNEPDKIKVQLTKHKEFQKALGSKQPVYDTTVRSGRAMRDKAQLPDDKQKLDHLVGEVRDKWDTVCGKSVERQHKLEEALLFSGQFAEALQALVDWLYRVEPQLAEDQPVHGDFDLVSNLMDAHKAFQKELGKRTTNIQALKRSARDLMDTGRDDTAWVKVQLQELSNRWDTVCALSVTKQTRLQQAFKQAEEFRSAVQVLLEWLSEAEQSLRFRGVLPEEAETLQALLHAHRDFLGSVEDKRTDVNKAAGMGEAILTLCHPDSITTIKHWITIIRARFEEVLTWAKQHEQRLETALTEVLNNANLLEELLSWLQFAETTLIQRDTDPLPQDIPQLKSLITEHQSFMEEMTRKQPDVDKVTKSYKRKPSETLAERRGARKQQQQQQGAVQVTSANPRLNQLCARWQQVWLLALERQRKLNDALDRLEEVLTHLKEFANFDFDVWRKKYMRWMNHKKSRVMDFFRRIDKDQDGKITRQEFIDGILASKFPTSKLEMTAVADIFDRDGDGYIDYYEFVAALHPNKDAYRPTTDADKIEDEVTRQVAQCKCAKRFQVEQIGENKYRFFLGNQFGDSQQLRLVRILRSTVMVRVGGGWMALDEFLVKNDPCRARGRTNLELREKFILPEGASQGLAAFRSRGRRSKPGSRNASPTRSSSSASHSGASGPSAPSAPATPTTSASSRVWITTGSKLKRPTFHSSRGSLTGENGGTCHTSKTTRTGEDPKRGGSTTSGPTSRAGSRAGSRASSRRGSDASDASELQDARSVCSDASDTPRRPGGGAKPSKIPTISKKAPSPKTTSATKK